MTAPSEEQSQKLSSIEPYNALRATGHTHVRNISRTTGEDAGVVGGHVVDHGTAGGERRRDEG